MTSAGWEGGFLQPGWKVATMSGCVFGLIASFAANGLRPALAPLAMLIVLIPTLAAGRLLPLTQAAAHGACSWAVITVTFAWTRHFSDTWHGIPALLVILVLIEDMALLGSLSRRALYLSRRAR